MIVEEDIGTDSKNPTIMIITIHDIAPLASMSMEVSYLTES
jgi:hypothetical protein